MSMPEPTIRVAVDATNPGQYFACCGLLELADRLWPGAEGWFCDGEFCIACDGSLLYLLAVLVMDPPEEVLRLENGLEVKPILSPLKLSFDGGASTDVTLDAWMRIRVDRNVPGVVGNPPWNFWSGHQTPQGIWNPIRAALARRLLSLNSDTARALFSERELWTGRFGFDPGPAWNALDVGFSLNEHQLEVESSPAVELLAAVGIQRFRPVLAADRESFTYATWDSPLSPSVAAAAAAGAMTSPRSQVYRARVANRGQYGALTYSQLVSGDACE